MTSRFEDDIMKRAEDIATRYPGMRPALGDDPQLDEWIIKFLQIAERRGFRIILEPMVLKESDREG
jgi:hypothetical protein